MVPVKPLPPRPSLSVLAGIVLLGVILWFARSVLIPVALSILLTFILAPAVIALQRRRVSRTLAVLTVTLAALVCIGGAVFAVSVQIRELIQDLPSHTDNIRRKIRDLKGSGPGALDRLATMADTITRDLEPEEKEEDFSIPVSIKEEKSSGLAVYPAVAGQLLGVVGSIGLVIALTVSMLFKREDLRNRMIRLAGHGSLTSTTRAIDEATRRISRYLVIQLAINAGFGLIFGLGLVILGVPYALLWGLLAVVLRFIPYIGTWLSAAFPLLISFATAAGWAQPVLVIVLTVVMGVVTNNVIEPLLVSRTTGVSPVALVVAAAFWTWLWGPIGLVLTTPLMVCLGVLGRYVPQLQFLEVLVGTGPALDPRFGYYQRLLARDEGEAVELAETYLEEHSLEDLFDNVLVPTLARSREDHERGNLAAEDVSYIVTATRELLEEDVLPPRDETASENAPAAVVMGCPAKDDMDELALYMFEQVMGERCRVKNVSTKIVSAEVVELVKTEQPAAVCIAAIPPGGVAKARYLCKRLRARFPDLMIVVGCWGLTGDQAKLLAQLKAAGASHMATTMVETREQLAGFLHLLPHLQKPAPAPDDEAGQGSLAVSRAQP